MSFKTTVRPVHKAKFCYTDDKKTWLELTTLTDEQLEQVEEEITTEIIDFPVHPETGKMERVRTIERDTDAYFEKSRALFIVNFAGWVVDGKKIKCLGEDGKIIPESIETLFKVREFVQFYTKSLITLTSDFKERYGGTGEGKN